MTSFYFRTRNLAVFALLCAVCSPVFAADSNSTPKAAPTALLLTALTDGRWDIVHRDAIAWSVRDPNSEIALFLADVATSVTGNYDTDFKVLLKYDYPYSDNKAIDNLGTWIDTLVDSDVKNPNFLILKASLEVKTRGNTKKATEIFESILKLVPKNEFVIITLANSYGIQGRNTEAKALFDQALQLNPESAGAFDGLGVMATSRGDIKEAEKMFTKAVSMKRAGPIAWFNLGSIYYSQKQFPKACPALEKAVTLSPKMIDARFNLSGTYYSLGRKQDCIDQLKKIVEIDPDSTTGRRAANNLRQLGVEPNKPAVAPKPTDNLRQLGVEPNKPVVAPKPTDVAVTVNGVEITEGQVDTAAAPQMNRIAAGKSKIPPAFVEQLKKQIRSRTLERMIVEKLLDEQTKKLNIVVTPQDVIKHLEETGARQQPPLTLQDIKQLIQAQGRDFEELKKQIQDSPGMKYQKLINMQFAGKVNVTKEDAQKYYTENKSRFETPEQVRASHILIKPVSDPNIDPNKAKADAKAKAESLLEQITAGSDFATLAKANSQDPSSAPKGGDLGYFSKGKMVAPFDKAAFALKVGQVSDIVETKYGFHIIRLTDHKEAKLTSFEEAQKDITSTLDQQKKAKIAEDYIESLKKKASIVYPPGKEPVAPPATAPRVIYPNTSNSK